ncbi:MAG: chemotaxis protein CheR [Treponema sp.]|nr:chemotaxis protein CheR [Treponema sp.]
MIPNEPAAEIPKAVLSSPALLFLYYRVEQILGIRATSEALVKLNEHIETYCGYPFVENPEAYESVLTSREQIFEISETVTINETYFFREGAHFDLLARHLLPSLVKLNRPIQVCSAATSIGCEAYSLAMLLDYHAKNRYAGESFDFEIDAFDVCAGAIETAKNARYTANSLRSDGSAWKYIMDLYLAPDGAEYVVSHDIRKKVRFFTHNIMRGLNKQYDIIFFRNALIYFSSKNRFIVLNELTESLLGNGLLFLGISETPSAKHPLLTNRYMSDVFYFQKTTSDSHAVPRTVEVNAHPVNPRLVPPRSTEVKPAPEIVAKPNPVELPIHCGEVATIMETEEGEPNAMKILEAVTGEKNAPANAGDAALFSGSELAASVTFFLAIQDYRNACLVLSYLEKRNNGPLPSFLRGEYHMQRGDTGEARQCFEQAAGKEKAFWPAFYRLVSLTAGDRCEYKIKKARESIELGRDLRYECFLGGFSPDYFQRILERKLA